MNPSFGASSQVSTFSGWQFGARSGTLSGITVSIKRAAGAGPFGSSPGGANLEPSARELVDTQLVLTVGGSKMTPSKMVTTPWRRANYETVTIGGANDLWGLAASDMSSIATSLQLQYAFAAGMRITGGNPNITTRGWIDCITVELHYITTAVGSSPTPQLTTTTTTKSTTTTAAPVVVTSQQSSTSRVETTESMTQPETIPTTKGNLFIGLLLKSINNSF